MRTLQFMMVALLIALSLLMPMLYVLEQWPILSWVNHAWTLLISLLVASLYRNRCT